MSLEEEIERMKKELEVNENETEVNVDEEKTEQEPEKETVEEVKEPEEVKEEVKEETKQEEKPDAAAFARMRRELAAAKKEAEELKSKMKSEETTDYDAKVSNDLEEILRERQITKATQEFVILEENFKSTVPDYEDISNGYKEAIYQSLKIQNPYKSHIELLNDTKMTLLVKAGQFVNQGLDPIQELYEEAKSLGIRPNVKADEPLKEEVKKPKLDVIAKNKARNGGMLGAEGSGSGGLITKEMAAEMTVAEWSKLSASEKARLLA
jgi:hypothetical protein